MRTKQIMKSVNSGKRGPNRDSLAKSSGYWWTRLGVHGNIPRVFKLHCFENQDLCRNQSSKRSRVSAMTFSLRKEVIQPQVLLRLPCYDFTPIMSCTLDGCLLAVSTPASSTAHFRDVTGGVYKARERIHRGVLIRDY